MDLDLLKESVDKSNDWSIQVINDYFRAVIEFSKISKDLDAVYNVYQLQEKVLDRIDIEVNLADEITYFFFGTKEFVSLSEAIYDMYRAQWIKLLVLANNKKSL
jgi:hypothetical protein